MSTSVRIHYSSDPQVVKLSEDAQPQSSLPMTKPHAQNESSVPEEISQNLSYECSLGNTDYDSNVYEAIDEETTDVED